MSLRISIGTMCSRLTTILVTGFILIWFLPLILFARITWAVMWLMVIIGWTTWGGKQKINACGRSGSRE